ncbi:MAG TPA: hypothetical protein DCR93_27975 [Cytophagales bacterium]|nr:hypothetical protein [Cytophagales bacterium]HAP63177.1 hypothetical protein [Cytophagales bacterium]
MYLFDSVRPINLAFQWNGENVTAVNWVHAAFFALAIEAAILMFILNGKSMPSKLYALGSFATNILYYAPWERSIPDMVTTILVSAMLAGSIWFFSDLFAEKVSNIEEGAATTRLLASTAGPIVNGGENGNAARQGFKTTLPDGRAS